LLPVNYLNQSLFSFGKNPWEKGNADALQSLFHAVKNHWEKAPNGKAFFC